MEEMNGKFSLVLEEHGATRREFSEQLTEVRQKQDMFESLLKFSHDELKEEIQAVDKKLTSEIRDVGRKVDGHEDRIRFLEGKVA